MDIAEIRREYALGGLDRADLALNPIHQFERWFAHASGTSDGHHRKIGIAFYKLGLALIGRAPADVNAMTLATVGADGSPSSRTVLLKGVDARGFIFFTNYASRKGHELAQNPRASLTFFWADDERQVCVAGSVSQLPREESEKYFRSRPRSSQIGAWASAQSSAVADRRALEASWTAVATRFPKDIPIPPHWGGYVLSPTRIEFWQGRPSRLHDRFSYTKQSGGEWKLERLAP